MDVYPFGEDSYPEEGDAQAIEEAAVLLHRRALIIFRENNVRLTPYALGFVHLAAHGFVKDPPRSPVPEFRGDLYRPGAPFWVETGETIAREGAEDDNVRREVIHNRRVSFSIIARALTDAGHRVLARSGFKG